jgi:hypothetical protein
MKPWKNYTFKIQPANLILFSAFLDVHFRLNKSFVLGYMGFCAQFCTVLKAVTKHCCQVVNTPLFGRPWVQISAHNPAILTEVFHRFFQSFQANAGNALN